MYVDYHTKACNTNINSVNYIYTQNFNSCIFIVTTILLPATLKYDDNRGHSYTSLVSSPDVPMLIVETLSGDISQFS